MFGSGKTTLAKKIADDFNGTLVLESFSDNPFLPKFYQNPRKYAISLELFFMAERFQQYKTLVEGRDLFKDLTVTDFLFAKSLLFATINLEGDEATLFRKLFKTIEPLIPQPELIVYLHNTVDNLLENIAKRGRAYEQTIKADYLETIQRSYLDFFKTRIDAKVLVLDVSKINFVEDLNDYEKIIQLIKRLYTTEYTLSNPKLDQNNIRFRIPILSSILLLLVHAVLFKGNLLHPPYNSVCPRYNWFGFPSLSAKY